MKPSTAPPASEHDCRYLVGIDLGTTNSVVHYVDLEADRRIQPFPIPQLVALGEIAALPQLPSFAYVSADHEAPAGTLDLPWAQPDAVIVGTLARDQGALVPERLISSAKSWLAHAGVDRTRGILPWGSDLGDRKLSPLEVSYRFLEHIRQAWDHRMGSQRDRHGTPARLAEQQVLLTVPASFDDVARQLTVEAARRAGLAHLTLIEEPLAAFYAWLAENEYAWSATLQPGQTVLVVDVGGGTTDFSLVAIEPGPTLRRTAVGDHLLLGGDNMDMALARRAEKAWGKPLPTRQWFQLCQLCRRAKEALLA
ncbi:MAG: Hsp70 family protein, partial [Lentisphaerae bacterium]|nr:Hsp70 family protein [Lentisphaerota bacterium]